MKRRIFIQNITLLTGGLLTACHAPAETFEPGRKKIKGQVLSNGKGIKNVVVSDGYTVIATDAKGKYEIEPHAAATNIFISTPSGYAFKNENGIARHYYSLNNISSGNM
ncbi:MAG TPA: metallophosphoesterase N-terminal domain-containing protein [Chitinophagaceae bacterium]|nr:metallophosphoesterase N-terminal domain-containing protein [Chitinophagaceae bacterium]